MGYAVKLLPAAYKDLRDAKIWYNEQQENLGDAFKLEANKAIDYLSVNPEHFQYKLKELRQSPVERFPYVVYYLIDEENKQVIVFGVLHTKRSLKNIKKRNR